MGHFSPLHSDKNAIIPGLGAIHSQSVGSTAYTTGFDHYFLAEGAEKPVGGSVRFSAKVAEDGKIVWQFIHAIGPNARKRDYKQPALTEETQVDFPAAAVAEMRRITETLHERDQTGWMFHAHGAIDMELRDRLRKEEDLTRSVETLTDLLANPAEPVKHFVPSAESETGRGFFRDATAAEKAERRAMWTERRERADAKLTALKAEQGNRVALLKRLAKALTEWAHKKRSCKVSIYDIYQGAISAPAVEAVAA